MSNYETCFYCGKIIGYAGTLFSYYCNLECKFKLDNDGPLPEDAKQNNFEASLIVFNKKREERFGRKMKERRER